MEAVSRRGLGVVVGFVMSVSVGGVIAASGACRPDAGPQGELRGSFVESDGPGAVSPLPGGGEIAGASSGQVAATVPGMAPTASAATSSAAAAVDVPYDGPYLGATAFQTPIYPEPRFGDERLGYIRQGGKVPVDPTPIKRPNCKEGWYRLIDGGYVCGKYSTLDLQHPRVKLGVKTPDLGAILPYQYAYNRFHGTPLYKTLPTRDEMLKYEPYIAEKEKKKPKEEAAASTQSGGGAGGGSSAGEAADAERRKGKHVAGPSPETEGGAVPSTDVANAEAAVAAVTKLETTADGSETAPPTPAPWWQSGDDKPVVSLSDLESDADHNLSKRMVKGFFIAVDKTFGWNNRLWYRTTSGLLAPTDRMWINKPPESEGIAWPEGAKQVGFILADKASKYEIETGKKPKDVGKIARFAGVALTGKTLELDGTTYRECAGSFWIKGAQSAVTEPGVRPPEVAVTERWVDVDLSSRTLVLFEGDKPVYAALISPGKKSRNKKKDHATPTGMWRVREKHVAVTMDGDGVAGDMPYSIEDVPYVAYFKGSYALHGAFWHSNFGREMSHGCVNLAPRDAKHVFSFVEPRVPRGWHAVFATKDRPGSMIVLHD